MSNPIAQAEMQPEKSFGEAIIEELSEFADTLEDASMTVVAEDPGAGPLENIDQVEIAGLWFSADPRCQNRPLLLVSHETVRRLAFRLGQNNSGTAVPAVTELMKRAYGLLWQVEGVTGVKI